MEGAIPASSAVGSQAVGFGPHRRQAAPIDSLTALRGLAALWVVGLHCQRHVFGLFPALEGLRPLLSVGNFAVPYFFILSGFVLSYNYMADFRRLAAAPHLLFVGRRFVRIYPVHLFTLLCLLAVVLAAPSLGMALQEDDKYSSVYFGLNLFLIQTWVPYYQLNWNSPAWSISSEWFAYLLFPVLCAGINRLTSLRVAGAAVGLGWASTIAFYTLGGGLPFYYVLCVLPPFLTGCLLWRCIHLRVGRPIPPRWLPDVFVVAILVTPFVLAGIPDLSRQAWHAIIVGLMTTYFVGTIYGFGSLGNSCSRIWLSKPLLFLGETSYSLYMTHVLVMGLCPKLLPVERYAEGGLLARVLIGCAYIACLAVGTLGTYSFVEKPARKGLAKLLPRPTAPLPTPSHSCG